MHTFFFLHVCALCYKFILKNASFISDIPLHQEKLVCEHVKVTNNFTVRRWFKLFGTSANYQRWWHGFGSAMFTLFTYKAVDSMATVNGTPCASYKTDFGSLISK